MFNFKKYGYIFCIPAVTIILVFAIYPVIHSFILSFFSLDLRTNILKFVHLSNYVSLFSNSRTFLSFYNTVFFTVISVLLELVFGIALALLIHRQFIGKNVTRAFSLVPWAIPTVVAALLWRWIFNDRFGLLNEVFIRLGFFDSPKALLSSPFISRIAVVMVEVWKTTPFMALIILAGLSMIPNEIYESAKVDGAGVWKSFTKITLPLLQPTILVALLFRTMDALRIFDTVFVLTGGGPGNATETLSVYTYKVMFSHLELGKGSALAVIVFLTVTLVSLLYLYFIKKVRAADEI